MSNQELRCILTSFALGITSVICPPAGLAITAGLAATSTTMCVVGKVTNNEELEKAGSDLAGIALDAMGP